VDLRRGDAGIRFGHPEESEGVRVCGIDRQHRMRFFSATSRPPSGGNGRFAFIEQDIHAALHALTEHDTQ
jgi:hypothetical protein